VAGPPAAVLEQLQHDIAAALATPEVRGRAELAGFEITPSTPQALRERIQADITLYTPLVSEGRIAQM
jgi:tripartite-type tricarboxylate transporter receptor subunit TctC